MRFRLACLLLAACQVTEDDQNDQVTVQYNEDVAENALADVANGAEEAGEAIANGAEQGRISEGEAGLRVRYHLRREVAPYVGVSWVRRFGRTRELRGDDGSGARVTAGVRLWF